MPNKGILYARSVIKKLYINRPLQYEIEDIVNYRGPFIRNRELPSAEGAIIFHGNEALILVDSNITLEEKKRFVLAHELGHYEIHRALAPYFKCNENDFQDWSSNKILETEANYFAAELLMPSEIFLNYSKYDRFGPEILRNISSSFGTSLLSTAIRYADIGNDPVAMFFIKNNQIKWYKAANFPYFVELGARNRIPTGTLTYEYIKKGSLEENQVEVDPRNWHIKIEEVNSLKFIETVLPFDHFGYILTFISIAK